MSTRYTHLGGFSDWVEAAHQQGKLYPLASPGPQTRQQLREVLGFCAGPATPLDVQVERSWEKDGLAGEEVSWWAGFGPRTHAMVLKPAGAREPLPGVIALHDHGGFKWLGKEKIADGPAAPPEMILNFRQKYYGGRAFANALAKEGFVVLVHDTFLWGSRRFRWEDIPEGLRALATTVVASQKPDGVTPPEVSLYHQAAYHHELWVEKYCALLGTTLAGVVCREDRIALDYLLSRPDVLPGGAGCLGLSGGGNRTALLLATHDGVRAAVIVGLMCTYAALLDHNVMSHTWMLFPHGWARYGDWPDVAASRADEPLPLLVQFDADDDLFPLEGMRAADERIAGHYHRSGHPESYRGQFYPGPHKFDLEMQAAAFEWLKGKLEP